MNILLRVYPGSFIASAAAWAVVEIDKDQALKLLLALQAMNHPWAEQVESITYFSAPPIRWYDWDEALEEDGREIIHPLPFGDAPDSEEIKVTEVRTVVYRSHVSFIGNDWDTGVETAYISADILEGIVDG